MPRAGITPDHYGRLLKLLRRELPDDVSNTRCCALLRMAPETVRKLRTEGLGPLPPIDEVLRPHDGFTEVAD